jgi:CelD/BcsL family acetyltransferase involved in cellulose biosynthesis
VTEALDIRVSATLCPGEWSRLVTEDEAATFFQTPEWSDVLTSTVPGFRAEHIAASAGGKPVAIVPVLGRPMFGTSTVESMAYGTFGGPVLGASAPGGTASALLAEFVRRAKSPRVRFAQLSDRSGRVGGDDLPGFVRNDDTLQVVRLDAEYDELLSRFKPSARNKIRKATKAGVTVRRAESEGDFLAYHAILEECSRDWQIRPRPGSEFFSALSMLDPAMVQMWLAVCDGDVIAGDLNFVSHGSIMNWGNVSTDGAKSLAPNNLLHAKGIEQGVLDGHHTYDLGSSRGLPGVRRFKESFGTVDVPIGRFVMDAVWYRAARRLAQAGAS